MLSSISQCVKCFVGDSIKEKGKILHQMIHLILMNPTTCLEIFKQKFKGGRVIFTLHNNSGASVHVRTSQLHHCGHLEVTNFNYQVISSVKVVISFEMVATFYHQSHEHSQVEYLNLCVVVLVWCLFFSLKHSNHLLISS